MRVRVVGRYFNPKTGAFGPYAFRCWRLFGFMICRERDLRKVFEGYVKVVRVEG